MIAETFTPPPAAVALRDYQKTAVDSVGKEFRDGTKSTLVVSATGTGKSLVLAELARRDNLVGCNVLILVHRDELIRQLKRSCQSMGINALVEKADERALGEFQRLRGTRGAQTVIASVQTLRGARLESWDADSFDLIIVDEAHHATASGYRAVLQQFPGARVAGLTATADRLDGENVGQVFETLAFEYNLKDAIADKWLVPIEAMTMKTDPVIDLRDLRVTGGDFNQGDLEHVVNENIGVLVNAIADEDALEDRRTIAFTPNIASADALAAALNDVGFESKAVNGKSPDRSEILQDHQSGKFQVLVNCQLATEGYDDPEVSAILICKPTKSRAAYSQQVGRGTRLHPQSGKKNCRVVDFAYVTGKHKLVSPVDLYDNSKTPDEVVRMAIAMIESGEECDIGLALAEAENQYHAAQRAKIKRRAVNVTAAKFDPLLFCDLVGVLQHKDGYEWGNALPATTKQIEGLRRWGLNVQNSMGRGTASALYKTIGQRLDAGLTLPGTLAKLLESGIDPDAAMAMSEADGRAYLQAHPLGPTEKQIKMLSWKGVPDAVIAAMTRKQACERISAILNGD